MGRPGRYSPEARKRAIQMVWEHESEHASQWVACHKKSRLLEPPGYVPPVEFEQAYYDRQTAPAEAAVVT